MEAAIFAIAVGLAALLYQPAPDKVVLLPGPDGAVGRVIVTTPKGEQEISHAYETAAVQQNGRVETGSASAESVAERYGALLQARPARPASYLLYFVSGSDELTPESQTALAALKQDVATRPVPEILVIGHTDRVGAAEANEALSLQRAQMVADLLRQLGVQPKSLDVTGRGERDPLVPSADGVDEPRNRRVEVSVR
ncbi:OmpA family protein [Vogesella oryzae]|uniref:OmpA family protein n=1 Tax=Vogesella oryzae TaxID=1735285 RepID=UPI001581635E|nr:OmpA family protein [Vogesella oryzae]